MVWKNTISMVCDFLECVQVFITHVPNCIKGSMPMHVRLLGCT